MSEIWKPVRGWEKNYEISTKGKVRSLRTGNFLKPNLQAGYHRIQLSTVRPTVRARRVFIHRLMAETFLHRAPDKQWAAHVNGKRADNRIENIYWATSSENMQDKHKHGTMPVGDKSVKYKHGRYVGYSANRKNQKKKLDSAQEAK